MIWLGASAYKINVLDINGVQHPEYPRDNLQSPSAIGLSTAIASAYAAVESDLSSTTSNSLGASLIGYNPALTYPANTVGSAFSSYASLASSPIFTGSVTCPTINTSGAGISYGTVPIGALNLTGTPNNTTYLRGDGSWAVLANGYAILSSAGALATHTAASPTGTTSTTAVMMGAGGTITPVLSTRVIVTISGQMANATAGDGATIDIRYGTGTAPVNGAAVIGTLVGIAQTATSVTAAQKSGFSISYPITGLIVGTTYWFDISLMAITGGTATIAGVTAFAREV